MAKLSDSGKIGVFGGTFDPIHRGHIAVASAVLEHLNLDKVLLVVNSDQWLRSNPPVAPAEDRFNMVKLAVEGIPSLEASDVDIVRDGSTYTVDTLRDLREELGNSSRLYLIVGADSAESMNRWKDADQIAKLSQIVAVGRPGQQFNVDSLDESHPARGAEYLEGPMIDVSATDVRNALRTRQPVGELINPSVTEYIESRNLYR